MVSARATKDDAFLLSFVRIVAIRVALVIAVDDEPRRHNADTPGAFRHQFGIAPLRQRPAFAIEPAFLLGGPNGRRNTGLPINRFEIGIDGSLIFGIGEPPKKDGGKPDALNEWDDVAQ